MNKIGFMWVDGQIAEVLSFSMNMGYELVLFFVMHEGKSLKRERRAIELYLKLRA